MNIKEKTIDAFNSLPKGVKQDVSIDYGCSIWYFRELLVTSLQDNKEFYLKAINSISKVSEQSYKDAVKNNTKIQKQVLIIKQELNKK